MSDRLIMMLLSRKRLVLSAGLLLALTGLISWMTMPRQEDPSMPDRFGLVVTTFPGADAPTIERSIVAPIEESLSQVSDVKLVRSTARTNVAILRVELKDEVQSTVDAWDEVEAALEEAKEDFPARAGTPDLKTGLITDQEAVVLAVTGASDPMVLLDAARTIKASLLRLDGVSEVLLSSEPGEQITIDYNVHTERRLALPKTALIGQLRSRLQTIPGGSIKLGGRSTPIQPNAELPDIASLSQTMITLPTGAALPLDQIARVRKGPVEPAEVQMRLNGVPGVSLSVVPDKRINIVDFGGRVRAELTKLRPKLDPLSIEEMSFQPDRVETRLADLGRSLLLGIAIVALVLIAMMGLRLGLVVSSVVPLVALASLALFAVGGGILHQISVAALIIALGMLVDNAIVVVESVQRKLDAGQLASDAAVATVSELAVPLSTATGTTLAAFVPMASSTGPTGDFTRAIPIVIMLTLVLSYVFALIVSPVLAELFLRKRAAPGTRMDRFAHRLASVTTKYPWRVLLAAAFVVGTSGFCARFVDATFFPASGRNQLVVEMLLPEGSHLDEIDAAARTLETALLEQPKIEQVASFVGQSAPRFYYNLPNRPKSPHFAHLVIRTRSPQDIDGVRATILSIKQGHLPDVEVIPRELEQGPPLGAPIEVRLIGDDLDALHLASEQVMGALLEVKNTENIRQDLGIGTPSIIMNINDAATARRGLGRADVAQAILGQTRGLPAGELRSGPDPVPIYVRSADGELLQPTRLFSTSVGPSIPVGQLARLKVEWKPAAIHRRNSQRTLTVSAQLKSGASYGPAFAALRPKLDKMTFPEGVRYEFGGAAEGSGKANRAIAQGAPLGGLLLLFFLMAEFNSFRRVAIVLATVPLAAAGVVPGLLLADQPFGFMSLLGVIALIGVVVNNAIVLLDVVERRREEGRTIAEALTDAISIRTRPILLTTMTTVAGLMPLAFSTSPLWPPLAWAMIAGLIASTLLTLAVVPALYTLLLKPRSAGGTL